MSGGDWRRWELAGTGAKTMESSPAIPGPVATLTQEVLSYVPRVAPSKKTRFMGHGVWVYRSKCIYYKNAF
jgi:hypothetical protein